MTTDKQLAANRANAALSTGPRTPQGRANSKQNALSHGMYSPNLVIFHWESREQFDCLRAAYIQRHQPIDQCELDLVDRLVDATWRRNRMLSLETALLDLEISRSTDDVDREYGTGADPILRIAFAFEQRHGDQSTDRVQRHITSLDHCYSRARRELQILQGERFNANSESSPELDCATSPSASEDVAPTSSATNSTAKSEPLTTKIHIIPERTHSQSREPRSGELNMETASNDGPKSGEHR
jgi:hypothetical protein